MSLLKAVSADLSARTSSGTSLSPAVHHQPDRPHSDRAVQCFSVRAELDPGLLPRLLEPFAKRGLWPDKFYSQAIGADLPGQPAEAVIDIQIAGLDCASCDHIALQFRAMVGVQSVLTSQRATG